MNLQRFGVILLLLVAAVVGVSLYVNSKQPPAPQAQPAPANQPAAQAQPALVNQAAPATATAPAVSAEASPTTAPATGQAAEISAQTAPAAEAAAQWFVLPAPKQSVLLGSLQAPPDASKDPTGSFLFELDVISQGAALDTLKLSQYFSTDADKRLYQKNPQAYEQTRQQNPQKYKGHYSLLNPVRNEQTTYMPLSSGMLTVQVEGQAPVPWNLANRNWRIEQVQNDPAALEHTATLSWTLLRGAGRDPQPLLKLYKTYRIVREDYTVYVELRAQNLSDLPLTVTLEQTGPVGVPREDIRSDSRRLAIGRYVPTDAKVDVTRDDFSKLDKLILGTPQPVGTSTDDKPVVWEGIANKFFASMMYLVPRNEQNVSAADWPARFAYTAALENATSRVSMPSMTLAGLAIKPGSSTPTARLEVFAGPKKREMFISPKAAYHRPIYQRLNYLGTIDLGSCFLTPVWLTLGMMWLLQAFSVVSLGNYGVAIILLVFVVRLVLHPLVKKSQISMMHMQKLGPQMQKLREKYADNKEALNREMMQTYKQQGITPILGCLPMLLQMPIWFALFTALNAVVELRHAGFLPFWITDLSSPDVIASWSASYSLPLMGNQLHLLPILLTIGMFLQAKINPQMTGQSAAVTPEQQQQQKMMKYMMPLMMLFFFYSAPSGLNLYVMASTFAGVIEQVVIRKHIEQREAAAAAGETTVRLPGKGSRVSRVRKPRGPLWFKRG